MRKPKITFLPIGGTGALHIDFLPGPFGDAMEAKKGDGVGFFAPSGELQGVTFDDVSEKHDQQVLEFDRCKVEVAVTNGKIKHSVTSLPPQRKTGS